MSILKIKKVIVGKIWKNYISKYVFMDYSFIIREKSIIIKLSIFEIKRIIAVIIFFLFLIFVIKLKKKN